MTLRRKIAWLLVLALSLAFLLSALTSIQQTSRLMRRGLAVSEASLAAAAEGEARSVFASFEIGTRGSLERGEMEPFAKLLGSLAQVERVTELGLTDPAGRVKFASAPRSVGQRLGRSEVTGAVAAAGNLLTVRDSRALLLLRPHRFDTECLRCHGGARAGDVAGILYLRYDLRPLRKEQRRLGSLLATMERNALYYSVGIGLGALLLTWLVVYLLLGGLVIRPLDRLGQTLRAVDRGALEARVRARGTDEIAAVSHALDRMTSRLSGVVTGIEGSSESLGRASAAIARSSAEVTAAAERQAASVADTSAGVEGIVASVGRVGERVDALHHATAECGTSVAELGASIGEVAETADTLAKDAEEIAASVQEIHASLAATAETAVQLRHSAVSSAASVSQMSTAVSEVEEQARHMASITGNVTADALEGQRAVEATIRGIGEIGSAFDLTFQVIQQLSDKMRSIGAILSVIDEVTGQTNLLALNAAIIAAQAGEHGKGFAVVADEIRDLADRTGTSSRDIARVIAGLRAETQRAVEALSQVDRSIHEGRALALRAGTALAGIVTGVEGASAGIERIAQAAMEQAAGINVIRGTVTAVSESVTQGSASAEEQSRSATLIARAVARMRELAELVRRATREQSTASRTIARAVTDVSDLAQEIRGAMEDQARRADGIQGAVREFRASTEGNVATAHKLDRVVQDVGREVEGLRRSVDTLRRPDG